MKSLPVPVVIFIIILALPLILWATATQNADYRGFADEGSPTPTITPSATPTPSVTNTPTATPTITPTPTNSPPRCNGISVNPGAGTKPLTVNFSCAGYDPDNDITAAEFGFGGDQKRLVEKSVGRFGSITTTYTYTEAGRYNVTCRLRDNNMAFSSYPDYCTYTVIVTGNALTPTPIRTPMPTRTPQRDDDDLLLFTGSAPTQTPQPTAVPTIAVPLPTPAPTFWSNEKFAQLVMMVIVSGITIIVALLLHGFFEKKT